MTLAAVGRVGFGRDGLTFAMGLPQCVHDRPAKKSVSTPYIKVWHFGGMRGAGSHDTAMGYGSFLAKTRANR
jgi:hypothetical protein